MSANERLHNFLDRKYPVENPKVVLVTGATSGIGWATAVLLIELGHHVAAIGRRRERLDALINETQGMFGELLVLQADVTDPKSIRKAAAETLAHFNRLDVLVANAGIGHRGRIVESDWTDIETVLRTNIDGVLHSVRACVPMMRAGGGGQIITISSVTGPVPTPGAAIYGASKATVDSLAQALRVELKQDHLAVTNILVGQTHTEFAQKRLGHAGRVASKWPTMEPGQVAGGVIRAMTTHQRTLILRWPDRLLVFAGRFFPWIMDRVMAKIYLKD